MVNKKEKGIAIVSALIFMTIIIAVSGLLFTLMASLNAKNIVQKKKIEQQITFQQIKKDFKEDGKINGEYDYNIEIFNNTNASKSGVQAVVVKKYSSASATDLLYYMIYDFDNQKILAEQTENFYITIKNVDDVNFYYLANIVKYKEV
ncbi:MAG TPA: hypothetical protein DCO89_03190 [Clostridiales bacterium]|nr:hypothetical protein [Clostridiales bacterium]